MRTRLKSFPLLGECGLLAAALLAYHFLLRWLMVSHGLKLGAVSYRLAPLYAYWRPHLKGWSILPLVVLTLYCLRLRRTRIVTSMTTGGAVCFFVLALVLVTASVAMIDGGPRALIGPLQRTDLEYYGAVDRVDGIREFLRDYPRIAPSLPMHAQVHPPGAVLFLWAAAQVFGAGPWGAVAWIISFSSLSVVVVYWWAERLSGPGVARRAAALFVLCPSVVLFTATSMDGPFALGLVATMAFYWQGLQRRPLLWGTLAGLCAAAASMMTYSVTVAMLFCVLATVIAHFSDPGNRVCHLLVACSAVAAFMAAGLALWLGTGYDPIETFGVAVANSNEIMAGSRHESPMRYVHIALGNLVVFFVSAGLPCCVLWWQVAVGRIREWFQTRRQGRFELTAASTLLFAASVPVYVLEVERVWMFLIPLVLIPVAQRLFELERGTGQVRATMAVAVLLAGQTLLTEVLLSTYW